MKTPFTLEQFLDVFKNYNEAVFPLQIVFNLIAIVCFYFAIKREKISDIIISIILAFFWLWMGVVYHVVFFSPINKAAYLFGTLFIIQGILLLVFGVFQDKLSFKFNSDINGIAGIVLILFALIIYPVIGYFLGHVYPSSPTFGLPCPTTIFTFGLLLLTDKKCPVIILVIPVIWSVIGFTAAFNFGIVEDVGLLISGLLALPILLIKNKKYKKA